MRYQVILPKPVQKVLLRLPGEISSRIRERLHELERNPRPAGCKKLTGRPAWRIRVGNYRIIYEIHDARLLVIIINAGHRREIYREIR